MTTQADTGENAPAHVEEAVRASVELHAKHERSATPLTHSIRILTSQLGRPTAILIFVLAVIAWILFNTILFHNGSVTLDPPPYDKLGIVLAVMAVLVTMLILTTQQHDNRLLENRVKLILELGILNEQKSAKIIDMLDTLRRDMPGVSSASDPAAEALSVAVTPQAMLESLEQSRNKLDAEVLPSNTLEQQEKKSKK